MRVKYESEKIRSDVPSSHQIKIYNPIFGDVPIVGHLPEEYGFSLGSEYTEPFGNLVPDQGPSLIAGQAAFGVSMRQGLITEKFYSGPEPVEFNLDIVFHSFYSAEEEVVLPIVKLLFLAVGLDNRVINDTEAVNDALGATGILSQLPSNSLGVRVTDWIEDFEFSVFQSHQPSTIKFGDFLELSNNVFIQNVTCNFNNIMEEGKDGSGYPTKGTASISALFKKPPAAQEIANYFGVSRLASIDV